MDNKEKGIATFGNGFNCAQAVFSALSNEIGIEKITAIKVVGAFGSGMGRNGLTCGAVSGALMAIGHKFGKDCQENTTGKDFTNNLVNQFFKEFKEANGSIECKTLLDYDIAKEEEYKVAVNEGIFKKVCPKMVESAIVIAEKLLKS